MLESKHLAVDLKSGQTVYTISATPTLSSARTPWQGLTLEQHAAGEVDLMDKAPLGHVVALQLRHNAEFECRRNGEGATNRVTRAAGRLSVLPAMLPIAYRTRHLGEVVGVVLERSFFEFAAQDLLQTSGASLTPQVGLEDSLLAAAVMALKAEVEAGGPGGRAYAESIGATMALHLAHHYATKQVAPRESAEGLSKHQLRRAIEFIHEHLAQDLSLRDIAAALDLSHFHFARLFKKSTGLAPHQYIIRRRVERAKELLVVAKAPIVEVAVQVGFADQSHLALHFRRIYGMTPRAFRRQAGRGRQ